MDSGHINRKKGSGPGESGSKSSSNPNPVAQAGFLSRLLFIWLLPFLDRGTRRNLGPEDMYDVLKEQEAGFLGDQLQEEWEREKLLAKKLGRAPRLFRCLFRIHGAFYIFLGAILVFNECVIKVLQPVFLRWLIQSFYEDSSSSALDRYLYAGGLSLTILLYSIIIHGHVHYFICIGIKCKVALSVLIYRKALRLSKFAMRETTTGHVVNLLSTDVSRFDWNLFPPYIVAGPLQLGVFAYLLWKELGVAAFGGIGVVGLLLPLQFVVFKYSEKVREEFCKRTDARASFMNEVIIAIRVIKMYAWEKPISALIHKLRRLEVNYVTRLALLMASYLIIFHITAKIIVSIILVIYTLKGNYLTADTTFFLVSVVNTMLHACIFCVPLGASDIASVRVSIRRIQKYLLQEEYKLNHQESCQTILPQMLTIRDLKPALESPQTPSILMKEVTANWISDQPEPTLKSFNVDLSGNKLVMVIGPVGSGKSSFLNALISELPITSGSYSLQGSLAYDSQDAWLFSATVKQNILFGREYDASRYQSIVRVCGLEEDLKQFPHGNSTIVGERGVALSGGQKARLNLARCLYQVANIYLLDDPLSAVDAHVSRHIFEKCIKSHLDGTLRILVTHQLQYLPNADHIIVLKKGEILAQGSYEELLAQKVDFVSLLKSDHDSEMNKEGTTDEKAKKDGAAPGGHKDPHGQDEEPEFLEEQMAGGHVTLKTYLAYFKASKSVAASILILCGFIVTQVVTNGAEYWLAHWTKEEEEHYGDDEASTAAPVHAPTALFFSEFDRNSYLYVYVGLVAGATTLTIVTTVAFYRYCMRISVNMHNNMFSNIVRAPTRFFDFNPSGRVMNRFTKDLGIIDEKLPETLFDTTRIFFEMIGVVVIVCITNYFILVPTCLIVVALLVTRRFYVGPVRAIKRTEALSRSPIFTHLTASMQGLSTIRSSNSQPILNSQFESYQNTNTSSWFLYMCTSRWFATWLELESVLYLAAVTFSFFLLPASTVGGNIGLAISSALVLNLNFQWGMRQSTETENNMISVERVLEYSAIPTEASLESTPGKKPPKDWPKGGGIKFSSMSLSYGHDADIKDILKNLTFDVRPREKIGIVGRTGAGKSSIIAALFRMEEPRGVIQIDGVPTRDIGLHDLRRSISIIPQDPVLFSGTARYNLDPFDQYNDAEIWEALAEVHMKEAIPALDFTITDGGSNLSVGQRQLICLARAILRKNRIIVMDEATANVDPKTDELIQQTIRTKFGECTILTIAHRLHSVMDCDRILVLDNGTLMEYDHPHLLLSNPSGVLASMVEQMGQNGRETLHQIAAKSFQTRINEPPIDHARVDLNENECLDL